MTSDPGFLGTLQYLSRRRAVLIVGGIGLVTLAGWIYLISLDDGMAQMAMPELAPWAPRDFAFMFVMWAVMMVAMMLPSAAPTILMYAAILKKTDASGHEATRVAVFASGYLVVWAAFSAVATLLQWGLEQGALLSPMMSASSKLLAGGLLVAAGIYQLTPLKNSCLAHCRTPVAFLTGRWRSGTAAAFGIGATHGLYCLGCCWALMLLLFVGGVMNLLWVAVLAVLVLLEKLAPFGQIFARVTGVACIGAGVLAVAA